MKALLTGLLVLVVSSVPASAADTVLIDLDPRPFLPMDFYSPNDSQVYTHQIQLTTLVLRESGWTKEVVLERLKKVAKIYAQCGVEFIGGELLTASDVSGRIQTLAQTDPFHHELLTKLNFLPSPLLIYHRGADGGPYGYSMNNTTKGQVRASFVAFNQSEQMKQVAPPAYSLEANLLGHLILSHDIRTTTPNLMADDYARSSDRLTPQQCAQVKRNIWVRENSRSTPAAALTGLSCRATSEKEETFFLMDDRLNDLSQIATGYANRSDCENSLLHSRNGLVCRPWMENDKVDGYFVYSLDLKRHQGAAEDRFAALEDCLRATRFSRKDRLCSAYQGKYQPWAIATNHPLGPGFESMDECEAALVKPVRGASTFDDL